MARSRVAKHGGNEKGGVELSASDNVAAGIVLVNRISWLCNALKLLSLSVYERNLARKTGMLLSICRGIARIFSRNLEANIARGVRVW